jgi:glyoxylase-like metal-dependent hydrolase (beta-lactamase superfamily II)
LVTRLARGLSYVDLQFLGRRHAIATGILESAGEVALVDPGPTSCLEHLEAGLQAQGIRLDDVSHLLLTHIHLDHAGATGTIVKRVPHVKVFVHERGATHLIDPAKLLDSATRLYGAADMSRLWGEFLAVPRANVMSLGGGERVVVADRTFDVAYTPGHASHHVGYFDASSGLAFVGDTAGMSIDGGYVLPPTPPPDIDIELWTSSAATIERWGAQTLFLTHFGPVQSPTTHLQTLVEHLHTISQIARATLLEEGTDEERGRRFADRLEREIRKTMGDSHMGSYIVSAPFEFLWLGLARYWRKKGVG